jgi:hypothetical protein
MLWDSRDLISLWMLASLGLLLCISRTLLSLRLLDCETNLLLTLPDSRAIIRLWVLDFWTHLLLLLSTFDQLFSLALLNSKFFGRSIFEQLFSFSLLNYNFLERSLFEQLFNFAFLKYRFLGRSLYLFQQPLLWVKSLETGVKS